MDPLKIDHILDYVLAHLIWPQGQQFRGRNADLENIRLVSRHWNYVSTHLFRRDRKSLALSAEGDSRTGKIAAEDFLSVMNSPTALIPSEAFTIYSNLLRQRTENLLKSFFSLCGSCLVQLELSIDDSSDIGVGRLGLARNEFPVLKNLVIHIRSDSPPPEAFDLIPALLKCAKSLVSFHLKSWMLTTSFLITDKCRRCLSRQLGKALTSTWPDSLKVLELNLILGRQPVKVLPLEAKFQLTSFEYRFAGQIDSGELQQFLEKQSTTLRNLKICNVDHADNGVLPVPFLGRLETLEIFEAEVRPICATPFPNLKELNVSRWRTEETFMTFLDEVGTAPLVEKIYFPVLSNETVVRKVGLVFPNLRWVEVASHRRMAFEPVVRAVCAWLLDIEGLVIRCQDKFDFDLMLTGIPLECVNAILTEKRDFEDVDIWKWKQHSAVIDFKRLRSIEIVSGSSYRLNDLTAHLLLGMESLKEMSVCDGCLSPQYKRKLEQKVVLRDHEAFKHDWDKVIKIGDKFN